jgi:hypothetical protein
MPSKIEKELTPEQVVELLETLAKTEGGAVLRVIQAEARKRGIEVSLVGASSFRDGALHPYLAKLKAARQKSEMLADAVAEGDESGLLAGARTILAERVADFLLDDGDGVNQKQFSALAKTLAMLSGANQSDKITNARLREYEAKEAERSAAKAVLEKRKGQLLEKGGLSAEAIQLMEDTLQILA